MREGGYSRLKTDKEGDNYFATREEKKTSGSCASVIPISDPMDSRSKYHCDRSPKKTEEDEEERRQREERWRGKEEEIGSLVVRAKTRSIDRTCPSTTTIR